MVGQMTLQDEITAVKCARHISALLSLYLFGFLCRKSSSSLSYYSIQIKYYYDFI
jgi:hypothetical protein